MYFRIHFGSRLRAPLICSYAVVLHRSLDLHALQPMISAAVLALVFASAAGHGVIYEPPARASGGMNILSPTCAGGSCLWFNQGSSIGCPKCTGKGTVFPQAADCKNPAQPTNNDKKTRTWNLNNLLGDYTKYHPWRKPGAAPVENACGLAGGWYTPGVPPNGGHPPPGIAVGADGSELSKLLLQTVWIAGSTVEVAWGITANHGGGYSYRLCPASSKPTEECFQQTPLEFVGDKQWIQFGMGKDVNNRTEIPAVRVSEGTVPSGSIWTRNPIPACNTPIAGGAVNTPCTGPIFPPPIKGGQNYWGFGGGGCQSDPGSGLPCSAKEYKSRIFDFGIVDKVKVPKLPDGDYVIGFRWDSEQTPQVWTSCGDVTIKSDGVPTKPFAPSSGGCEACCPGFKQAQCANCTGCLQKKTGTCAYCWNPLAGYFPGGPKVACLGHEAPDGGERDWQPGDPTDVPWSPGCPKCWADKDACKQKKFYGNGFVPVLV